MLEKSTGSDRFGAGVKSPGSVDGQARVAGHWAVTIRDPQGNVIREDAFQNIVVNEGLDELLTQALNGGTQTTTWYLGLTDGTPTTAAGDTLSSHDGWTEVTDYDETNRVEWASGSVSGQSIDNSDSVATFTISTDGTTVGGAFLASDDTKSGTTGTLYAVGAFSGGDVTLSSGSTLEVTATFTTSAA